MQPKILVEELPEIEVRNGLLHIEGTRGGSLAMPCYLAKALAKAVLASIEAYQTRPSNVVDESELRRRRPVFKAETNGH